MVAGFAKQRSYSASARGSKWLMPARPGADLAPQVVDGIGADQPLGQVERLDQEEPVVVRAGERLVGPAVHDPRRRDVEHGDAFDRVRVIEAQPVRDPGAAVVTGQHEARKPQARA